MPFSDAAAINQAFKEAAKNCHTDLGGDRHNWDRLQEAKAEALRLMVT